MAPPATSSTPTQNDKVPLLGVISLFLYTFADRALKRDAPASKHHNEKPLPCAAFRARCRMEVPNPLLCPRAPHAVHRVGAAIARYLALPFVRFDSNHDLCRRLCGASTGVVSARVWADVDAELPARLAAGDGAHGVAGGGADVRHSGLRNGVECASDQ